MPAPPLRLARPEHALAGNHYLSATFTNHDGCLSVTPLRRIRHAFRARLWCCSVYQIGAYSSSSSNDSKNASATILNCESSDFSPPLRGTAFWSKGHGTMLLPSRSLGFLRLRGLSRGPGLTNFATLRWILQH